MNTSEPKNFENKIVVPSEKKIPPPVVVPEDGSSRLHQMMREHARGNGGLHPYFQK